MLGENSADIVVVLGTRPEIVKLAPVIRALAAPPTVVHTGQHYDPGMAGVFFDAFGLSTPDHVLQVGGETRGQQIGIAVRELDQLFATRRPDAVIVQGDTNSTMAAAIAANARSIPLIHVEAGLRSYDRSMPEEHNRVVTDHLSDLCLAPTDVSAANLAAEGVEGEGVVVTGNTIVDAVNHLLPEAAHRSSVLDGHGLEPGGFVVSTFHRPENVDDPARLDVILEELAGLGPPVILPLHPRTRSVVAATGIDLRQDRIRVVDPLDYIEFLALLAECALAVSDSGGIQEEVSVLKKPMVVVRNSTERPEVLGTFCVLIAAGPGISVAGRAWLEGVPHTLDELADLPTPYGDGHAGEASVAAIEALLAH